MKQLTSNEIRNMWLSFFEKKNHLVVPSASLVPLGDKSILWINAGVTPLKKFFDGSSVPENKRLVNVQKCIRTTDIEEVGDTTHLTFFEMMGNFSVGDYFKNKAISWGFELLTSEEYFNIPLNKLYFTVYPSDTESKDLWKKLGVREDHIIELADNYWEIGEGPCGPCSEVFYDRGEEYDPKGQGINLIKNDIDNDRFVEIWNIVFSTFNAIDGVDRDDYKELPSKNIDTGMGFERVVMISQNANSIYDTDLFAPIIENIAIISGKTYNDNQASFRIIADHVRTITMALKDGASFGNTGRGYILRRLLRRASREGRELGISKTFMFRLVPVVIKIMQDFYPFTGDETKTIMDLVMTEETLFHKTLASGEEKLKGILAEPGIAMVKAEDAFKLYDTYGFPLELTIEIAKKARVAVDTEGFSALMDNQKQRSGANTNMVSNMTLQNADLINCKVESKFVGHETFHTHTNAVACFDKDGNRVTDLSNGGFIILGETPFYAENGGQVADRGYMRTDKYADNDKLIVENVILAPNGQHLHKVRIHGTVSQGEPIEAKIDKDFRDKVTINHSAAHLLHHALAEVLNEKVHQAGSHLDDKRIRFDFNFAGDVTDEKLLAIEQLTNSFLKPSAVIREEMTLEEAKLAGATALFDEKYGVYVNTIKIGPTFELCGGTHVKNVSEINKFALLSCESKGANVYRLVATTNDNVYILLTEEVKPYKAEIKKLLVKAGKIVSEADKLGCEISFDFDFELSSLSSYGDVVSYKQALQKLSNDVKALEKTFNKAKQEQALEDLSDFVNNINNRALIMSVPNFEIDTLKAIADKISNEHDLALTFLVTVKAGSINFICKANDPNLHAGDIIRETAALVGGNGGGSKTFGQGGGTTPNVAQTVIERVNAIYREVI